MRRSALLFASTVTIAASSAAICADFAPDLLATALLDRIAIHPTPACLVAATVADSTKVAFACRRDAPASSLDRETSFELGTLAPLMWPWLGAERASLDDMLWVAGRLRGEEAVTGWSERVLPSGRAYYASGGTASTQATIVVVPSTRRAAVVLSGSAAGFEDLAFHLADPSVPLAREKPP